MAPQPETRWAVLMSEGNRRPTPHRYVETKPCAGGTAWEHLFRCEETGVVRRWGFEQRHSWEGS